MTKSVYLILLILIFSIVLIFFFQPSRDPNTKIMGVSLDYPPFEYIENGEPKGLSIDLAYLIASEMGFKLEIKDMDFNGLIPALNSNQVDFVISSISATPERAKTADFTIPYYRGKIEMVVQENKNFKPKKIGVQLGSSIETAAKNSDLFKNKEFLELSRVPQLIEELKLGRVDAVLLDSDVAQNVVEKNKELKKHVIEGFTQNNSIVLKKGSLLVAQFNKILKKLEDTGKLKELEKKWLDTTYLHKDKEIKIGQLNKIIYGFQKADLKSNYQDHLG